MKTFNYESNGKWYRECYFEIGEYENGERYLALSGYAKNENQVSHISDVTIEVPEKLKKNQVAIDNETNTNLISFLLDLGIVKGISKRVTSNSKSFPIVDLDLEKLYEYSYRLEGLKYAS